MKKIAYAASFGVDEWEFSKNQTFKYRKLLNLFDAVSVREDSAVELCHKYFGVKAQHVLDPTLLLNKEDYISLVEKNNTKKSDGDLFIYILDKSPVKDEIIDSIAKQYNLNSFSVFPQKEFSDVDRKYIQECIYPPVEQWIRAFMEAEFVITDSFHGSIFSILFEKQFIAIGNRERGLSRFKSLFKIFELEDRLIVDKFDISLLNNTINYSIVNQILKLQKEQSLNYITEFLILINYVYRTNLYYSSSL